MMGPMIRTLLIAVVFISTFGCQHQPSVHTPDPQSQTNIATFSIAAVDRETGELGIAVQSKFVAVGAVVPWAKAGVGAVASQAGVPVSLHGTGGAWIITGSAASAADVEAAVSHSLDRKVCNTLNCLVVLRSRATDLVPAALAGLDAAAARRGARGRLHVVDGSEQYVPEARFTTIVKIERAEGSVEEPASSTLPESELATEWEWENSPEMTIAVVDTVDEAVQLFNTYSPHFVASLISDDAEEHDVFYAAVDAPFVGNGFTRWVDGQYALDKPELGLSNWQGGRMLGRGGILSGDSVHTIRYRVEVTDTSTHR
jgi:glutamate-5-semialdehyde dehydrogenase